MLRELHGVFRATKTLIAAGNRWSTPLQGQEFLHWTPALLQQCRGSKFQGIKNAREVAAEEVKYRLAMKGAILFIKCPCRQWIVHVSSNQHEIVRSSSLWHAGKLIIGHENQLPSSRSCRASQELESWNKLQQVLCMQSSGRDGLSKGYLKQKLMKRPRRLKKLSGR